MTRKSLPFETLASLRVRLDQLSPKDPERKELIASTASLYGVSAETVYRALRQGYKSAGRSWQAPKAIKGGANSVL